MVVLDSGERILIIAGCCALLIICLLTMVCKLSPWCWCHKCCPFRPSYEPDTEKLVPNQSGVYNSMEESRAAGRPTGHDPFMQYNSSPKSLKRSSEISVGNRSLDSANFSTEDDEITGSYRSNRSKSSRSSGSYRSSKLSSGSRKSMKSKWPFVDQIFDSTGFSSDDGQSDSASFQELDLVRGEITLSLTFDSASRSLEVLLQKITNLSGRKTSRGKIAIKMQALSCMTPVEKILNLFQRLKLSDSEVEDNLIHEVYTRPREPSNNIIMDEVLTVPLKKEDVDKYCLRFICISYDKHSQGKPQCEVMIALKDYNILSESGITIKKVLTEPQQEEKGELILGLTYLPTSQKLTVSPLSVKGLKLAEQTDNNSVVYVKIALARRGVHSKKRVHGKKASTDIKWEEGIQFDLPREHIHDVSMVLSVKQLVTSADTGEAVGSVREHALGKVALGLNSGTSRAQAHWRDILQAPRQCVTQTHFVY